jgi:ribosomal protein L11 methyltransferase
VEVLAGSVDVVGDERFDLVIANLDTATLSRLAGDLAARLRPDGTLIASGVSNERTDEAVGALQAAGLRVVATAGDEWALLLGEREP